MTEASRTLDRTLLDQLAACWRARGVPVLKRLRPGLTEREMRDAVRPLGLELPAEALAWWGWHDGAELAPGDEMARMIAIAPGLPYLPLAEAVSRCRQWREISDDHREFAGGEQPDPWWSATWIPITDAGQAGIVALECDVEPAAPSPIRCVLPPEPGPIETPIYASLRDLVLGWIAAYREGAWRYDDGWRLAEDRPDVERRLFG